MRDILILQGIWLNAQVPPPPPDVAHVGSWLLQGVGRSVIFVLGGVAGVMF